MIAGIVRISPCDQIYRNFSNYLWHLSPHLQSIPGKSVRGVPHTPILSIVFFLAHLTAYSARHLQQHETFNLNPRGQEISLDKLCLLKKLKKLQFNYVLCFILCDYQIWSQKTNDRTEYVIDHRLVELIYRLKVSQ